VRNKWNFMMTRFQTIISEWKNIKFLKLPAIQVLRMLVATGMAWYVADTFGLAQAHWAAITALITVQSTPGATVRAGRDRMLATGFGVAMGALAGIAQLHGWPTLLAWILALAPTMVVAYARVVFRTAPVAAMIVLSSSITSASPLQVALLRAAEISLGAVIGMAISRWLIPASARERILHHAVRLAAALASHAAKIGLERNVGSPVDTSRADAIRSNLWEIALIAHDAQRTGASGQEIAALAQSLRRLSEDCLFVVRTSALARSQVPQLASSLQALGAGMREDLDALRAMLAGDAASAKISCLDASSLLSVSAAEGTRTLELKAALSFGFCSVRRQVEAVSVALECIETSRSV
jgi:uncharacterized membrane protein YccC